MEFFKNTSKPLLIAILLFLGWAFDQLYGQIFTDWFFGYIPQRHRGMLIQSLMIILFGFLGFCFGRDWHRHYKPVTRFKMFLKKKINQAEELCNSNLVDYDPSVTSTESPMIEKFMRAYAKWHMESYRGIKHSLNDEYFADRFQYFQDVHIQPSGIAGGRYRTDVKNELNELWILHNHVKTDWMSKEFNPDILDDYEDLKIG